MSTEMINIRLEKKFLQHIDRIVKTQNYQSRTELIRESLREKIEEEKIKKAVLSLKGSEKTNISDRKIKELLNKKLRDKFQA